MYLENHKSWKDWKWQLKNRITTIEEVEKVLDCNFNEDKKKVLKKTIEKFPLSITPYYLSLVDASDYDNDPVFKQAFPQVKELEVCRADIEDPLGEEDDSPIKGITHRYPDRVLFHVSNVCAMYCRHCTRKRKVGDKEYNPMKEDYEAGFKYIESHHEVRDVLLSGGDPFLLSNDLIDYLLERLSKIPHVELIRIGTRTPVVLPYRITEELVDVLSKYKNLWINTHFNHPKEITEEAIEALDKLAGCGIPLGNQSVLLANVNDCPRIMKKLVHKLTANRVRPYYLYQCDLSEGLEHFRTSIGRGIEIMESLRGHTSGLAVPTYVIDAPGGGGKIPVMPNYLMSWSTNKAILRNYEGVITTYEEPNEYAQIACDLECRTCHLQLKLDKKDNIKSIGIEKLLSDNSEIITLTPIEE
ncbi:lysine 2,3-aminomutase [Vallitalea maricola]|uniref:Lysine 2,3-aminomutase n=1 Tax=Vallitalea maricola TaxID=3074433 RepID=A0ACB5UHS3_9FIRM|nr:lysine 2,3-aminomutase [Vallitalea sp. AN17-2]